MKVEKDGTLDDEKPHVGVLQAAAGAKPLLS